ARRGAVAKARRTPPAAVARATAPRHGGQGGELSPRHAALPRLLSHVRQLRGTAGKEGSCRQGTPHSPGCCRTCDSSAARRARRGAVAKARRTPPVAVARATAPRCRRARRGAVAKARRTPPAAVARATAPRRG